MKKVIAMLLVLAMALPLCGCGKSEAVKNVEALISSIGTVTLDSGNAIDAAQQAFDALTADEKGKVENHYVLSDSQSAFQKLEEEDTKKARFNCAREAYKNIKSVWDFVDTWAGDLYNAWHGAIMEEDEIEDNVIPYFVENTNLSEAEVSEGFAIVAYTYLSNKPDGVAWGSLSEERKQAWQDATVEAFNRSYPDFREAILMVTCVYGLNGNYQIALDTMETAKENMKIMGEQYADYEHYPSLKSFFTTTSAMLEFCASPSGSFQQYQNLLNDYRKEARDYINDLDYIFE